MAGLLPHDHPDLHRSSIVLLVNVDGLVGARRDLIRGGVPALVLDTRSSQRLLPCVHSLRLHLTLSQPCVPAAENGTNLPHVEDVLLPSGPLVRVQHQVAVASVKLPVHAGTDFGELQVLNTPHLSPQMAAA